MYSSKYLVSSSNRNYFNETKDMPISFDYKVSIGGEN